MEKSHSFTEYVKNRFDNEFWKISEKYIEDNISKININENKIHKLGEYEISDVRIEHIWVEDMPNMDIKFKVALSIYVEIQDGDYHYDNYDDKIIWILAECQGNLEKNLDDFEIKDYYEYSGKGILKNALDDSLVPYIQYEDLELVAEEILKKYYPESLKIMPMGKQPIWVDPIEFTKRVGLKIKTQTIRKDGTVFGQLYFEDTSVSLYDKKTDSDVITKVEGKTIIVDPNTYLLRNIGSVNNTIIHECVHWEKHRKAFKLEQLFNDSLSCISCQVAGGIESSIVKKSTEFIEKQANQITPRIQMPKASFVAKAKEYIAKFMRELNVTHEIDVMEQVIEQLAIDYVVSRQSVKIRLVQLGFINAIGTFNYVDGHYVRPHGFRKDSIKVNQTFTISECDAALQRAINLELREKTQNGDYLFIENHYVYNSPLYVEKSSNGNNILSNYARAHMDECCLVFDLKVTCNISNEYHTICYLNREDSNITYEVKYHNGFENSPQKRQIEMRKKQMAENMKIRKQMTEDPEQCMKLLLDWRDMDYTSLGAEIEVAPKTISRTVKGETTPKVETAALICFGLNLPPTISEKLMSVLGCKLNLNKEEHQWINEALQVKYPEPIWAIKEYLETYGVHLEK